MCCISFDLGLSRSLSEEGCSPMNPPARNELSRAASPYLLQHSSNPVHWRMWGEAALKEAQAVNKPILLSIGYAACHWCHVMAHESFEDEETAAVMNELFINIKVDREERPDVDHLYMSALHAFGEQGGWPLTMFLTPNGEPFWGGTYFPKTAKYGRPSFVSVLKAVAQAYHEKPQDIAHNTSFIRNALTKGAIREGAALNPEEMDRLSPQVAQLIDPINGGLRGAPKFPNTPILEFLWRAAARRAIRQTNAGSCLISRRCSTTMRRFSSSLRSAIINMEKSCFAPARARQHPGSTAR